MDIASILLAAGVIIGALFAAYNLLHYVLFLLAAHPKDAAKIGHELNQFERRQLVEWAPKAGRLSQTRRRASHLRRRVRRRIGASMTITARAFSRARLSLSRYAADYLLLKPKDGMRLLDLGCGSGAAADYFASQCDVDITCVTNSPVQADICRRKFEKYGGRVRVMVADFDGLNSRTRASSHLRVRIDRLFQGRRCLAGALLADAQAGRAPAHPLARVAGFLSPGKGLSERDRVFRELALQFSRRQYSRLQVASARLRPDTLSAPAVLGLGHDLEFHPAPDALEVQAADAHHGGAGGIIWRTSKVFVFGNGYNIVLASKPGVPASCLERIEAPGRATALR